MPHYINGSRHASVPINANRNYTVEVSMDWEGTQADMLYNNFYRDGNKFNMTLDLDADDTTGSQHSTFIINVEC